MHTRTHARTQHVPCCESFCSLCPICCRGGRRARRHDGASSTRERSRRRHSDWHSRPTYPAPCCSDTTRSSHSRRSLAWRTAAWAYLLAPPPWDCQVGCATCCLYAPLYLVLQTKPTTHLRIPFAYSFDMPGFLERKRRRRKKKQNFQYKISLDPNVWQCMQDETD